MSAIVLDFADERRRRVSPSPSPLPVGERVSLESPSPVLRERDGVRVPPSPHGGEGRGEGAGERDELVRVRIGDRVRWASGAGTIVEFLEAVRVDFDGPPEPHAVVSISEGDRRGVRCVVPVIRLEHAPPAREGGAA